MPPATWPKRFSAGSTLSKRRDFRRRIRNNPHIFCRHFTIGIGAAMVRNRVTAADHVGVRMLLLVESSALDPFQF